MTLFSICIPTYEMGGYGDKMLEDLFEKLKNQTIQDFEIIVSDQSKDLKIFDVCSKYFDIFHIKYIKNFYGIGKSSNNLNVCLDSATGKIIKILFQDDYFLNDNALEIIKKKFENENHKWVMNAFTHTYDGETYFNTLVPRLNNKLLEGYNTMGNPSCLSFLRSHKQYFDEDILYLVDCEMYYRMNLLYGEPGIIGEVLVAIRYHETSATTNPEFISKKDGEVNYCLNKYLQLV